MDQLVQDFNTALDETAGSSSARFEAKMKLELILYKVWGVKEKSLEEALQVNKQPGIS